MNILKKQGVAWVITIVMIVIAIGIGSAKAPTTPIPSVPEPGYSDEVSFYVYDDADVLSYDEEQKLSAINEELYSDYGTVVACVTTNYNKSNLYAFALDYADHIGLEEYDFIVVLDISGENYWLVQGSGLVNTISDTECGDYAWEYMEDYFARGDYGDALINLAEALQHWYRAND